MSSKPLNQPMQPIPSGQRRRAVVMFADLAESTPLAESLGEERAYEYIREVINVLVRVIEQHGGVVQEVMGDGVMALFGAPLAIENSPAAASHAAVEIHNAMKHRGKVLAETYGVEPRVRVGLHVGHVVVGEIGPNGSGDVTAIGDVVNTAARLQGLAEPTTTVVSEQMVKLLEDRAQVAPLGLKPLKGKSEPKAVFQLLSVSEANLGFTQANPQRETELIGRSGELDFLQDALSRARGGKPLAVNLVGEAGVGKSRLVYEFKRILRREEIYILEGSCLANRQGQPFLPLINLVRKSFRITRDMELDLVRDKLRRGLSSLEIEVGQAEPYLLNLLGYEVKDTDFSKLDDEVVGRRTRDAVLDMLRARCRFTTTVVIIEDIHWIDSGTKGLIRRIFEERDFPDLLLICTSRPGNHLEWTEPLNISKIGMGPLLPSQIEALIRSRLDVTSVPKELSGLVHSKSEGNPFFAEEVLNSLIERELLKTVNGTIVFQKPEKQQDVPITIENLLMDRVDRLSPEVRGFLEAASVIGRGFDASLASEIIDVTEHSETLLIDLLDRDIIVKKRSNVFAFKHELLRDAIYNSLMSKRRHALHSRVAERLETSGYSSDIVQALAHHWVNADRADKAIPALIRAGEESLRVYSLDEANAYFQSAQELIDANPNVVDEAQAVDLLLHAARIAYFQGLFSKIISIVETNLPRVEALGDKARLARFLFEGGYAKVFHGEQFEGKALLERSLALAEEIDSDIARAYAYLGISWFFVTWPPPDSDHWAESRRNAQLAFEIAEREADTWLASKALISLAHGGAVKGRPKEAMHYAQKLLEFSRTKNDPRPRTMGLYILALLGVTTGDGESAVDNAEEAIASALSPFDEGNARLFKAWGYGVLGRIEEFREAISHELAQRVISETGAARTSQKSMDGAVEVFEGNLARGMGLLKGGRRANREGNILAGEAVATDLIGDVYFAMIKGEQRPTLKVLLRNFWFLAATVPRLQALVRKNFEDLRSLAIRMDAPAFQAKALLRLGQLEVHQRNTSKARAFLDDARTIAIEAGAEHTLRETEMELRGLGA